MDKEVRRQICNECNKYMTTTPLSICKNYKHERLNKWHKNWENKKSSIFHRQVIIRYGGKCDCCGYNNINKKVVGRSFLQIHHIHGGGTKARTKGEHGGWTLARWLIRNNYPNGYTILCAACNISMEPDEKICEYHKEWK